MIPKWMEGLKTLCTCRHDPSKTGLTWGVFLSPDNLEDAVLRLFQAGFFLEDISGLDTTDGFVAVYHLSVYSGLDRVALYVIVSCEDPSIPSISAVYSGALWHERETKDFFGIRFTGHPDPRPLLLPEDMVDHPLLKEDKNRAALRDLLDPGEIVERDPDFLFFEGPDSPTDDAKPDGERPEALDGKS
jgi:NADH-quinone oxidoreductase subunit C